VPLADLYAAQLELSVELRAARDRARLGEIASDGLVVFGPVVDGEVLQRRPIESISAGAGSGTDVLAGSNSEEWRLFTVPNGLIDTVTEDALQAAVIACGLPAWALEVYRAARPDASPGDLLSAVMTDWSFRIRALRLAEAHAPSGRGTYVYEFNWR
jgi:carboxylesterase type B